MSFEIKRARGKTAVFSGTRQTSDHIPRLEELCIQKLLDNANKIECVGDVPYYILRPLLTKISLAQLKHIESHNPVSRLNNLSISIVSRLQICSVSNY